MNINSQLERVCQKLIKVASLKNLTVSTAESLTAGLVCSSLAEVPGASAVLKGGAVTYCDQAKNRILGVSKVTLEKHSAVSEQTACEMAIGALRRFDSDFSVSLTGFAGPDGGTLDNPAGTVYIGICGRGEEPVVECCHFMGSRNDVRKLAAMRAIELLCGRCVDSLCL